MSRDGQVQEAGKHQWGGEMDDVIAPQCLTLVSWQWREIIQRTCQPVQLNILEIQFSRF